jgi:hypothetical protein
LIPAGELQATLPIQSLAVSTATNATIYATAGTGASRSAALRVTPAATMEIAAIAFWESAVPGGEQNLLDIMLTKHVPAGGLEVSLESSDPAVLPLPGTILLEQGWPGATMLVTTNPVAADTLVTVTASIPGSTRSTELTVTVTPAGAAAAQAADDRGAKRKRAGGDLPRIAIDWPDPALAVALPLDQAAATGRIIAVARGEGAKGTRGAAAAFDGRVKTAWVMKRPTKRAFIDLDLGQRRQLTAIRWLQVKAGPVEVRVSVDGKHWTAVGRDGGVAAGTWQELTVATEARYVRLVFFAGGKKARLGHLAEVELVGPAVSDEPVSDRPAPPKAGADADAYGGTNAPTGDDSTGESGQPAAGKPGHDRKGKHDRNRGHGTARGKDKAGAARSKR